MKTALENQAAVLNRLPEVRWDRTAGGDAYRVVFGWVPGPNDRSDFVIISFWPDGYTMATSSRRYSEEFSRRLFPTDEHQPCRNVADHYGDLVPNKITHRRPLDPSLLGQ